MRHALVAVVAITIAVTGCLEESLNETLDTTAAGTKEDAGARTGDAPSAPKSAYKVAATDATDEGSDGAQETTAYPLSLRTNPAKEPATLEFTGTFEPTQCSAAGGSLDPTSSNWRMYDLSEGLEVRDVFRYTITLTFENTDRSWGEIHLFYRMGGESTPDDQATTGDQRGEITITYEGQGYRASEDATAWAAVSCWYGFITEPIDYTLVVEYRFAENALPSGAPMQMVVPEGATKLIVTGVPFDDDEGVVSHFRVFAPDEGLVCECALNSRSEASMLDLPVPGEYVVLVDHTSGGFVGMALDAPPVENLIPLETTWSADAVLTHEGPQAASEAGAVDLATTPLDMGVWTRPRGDDPNAAYGRGVTITVENARGEVVRIQNAGFVAVQGLPTQGDGWAWYGLPIPGEWAFNVDHHRFAPGTHEVTLEADQCDCEVFLWHQTYVRA